MCSSCTYTLCQLPPRRCTSFVQKPRIRSTEQKINIRFTELETQHMQTHCSEVGIQYIFFYVHIHILEAFLLYLGAGRSSKVERVVGSILHGVDPLSYFSFQPVLHDWCNKGRGMCYPVCGMVHIKEPLLLIDKSSLCGGSGFPFSLSEWSFTICPTHITINKMCWVHCEIEHFLPSCNSLWFRRMLLVIVINKMCAVQPSNTSTRLMCCVCWSVLHEPLGLFL